MNIKNITLSFALIFTTSLVSAETYYNSDGSYTINNGGTYYQYNSDGSSSYTIQQRNGNTNTYNSDSSSSYSIYNNGRRDTYNSDGSSSYELNSPYNPYR